MCCVRSKFKETAREPRNLAVIKFHNSFRNLLGDSGLPNWIATFGIRIFERQLEVLFKSIQIITMVYGNLRTPVEP